MIGALARRMGRTRIIALGFLIVIIIGTLLLLLPFATREGETTDVLTALFTATSASCVTGLVVVDTFTHWTTFGQIIILVMIQIGGLGFMTIGVLFTMFMKRRINLATRGMLQESINVLEVGGIVRLAKKIAIGTVIFEGGGALLLMIKFIPEMGAARGIYYGIFHAISAFCNAGFDLMGYKEAYSSFVSYRGDILVNVVIMALIIIGGLGFMVWDDISKKKLHFKKYLLHTKIVVCSSLILVFVSAILFYLFENDSLLTGMTGTEKTLSSLFSSVTARTAGMNTTDTGAMSSAGKLLTMILMMIGGSPGSTAGGVKTTTIVVLFVCVWSGLRSEKSCNIFGRRISDDTLKKAARVVMISFSMAITAAITICAIEPLAMEDILFEVFSAVGTVGMSTGITRSLGIVSRLMIILLMYCGRIGSMSFALSFTERKKVPPVQLPEERVIVG